MVTDPSKGKQDKGFHRGIWFVYLLRCGDGTLYCGIALDVDARLEQHRAGKGAKYTRGRGPLELVYREPCDTKAAALRRERVVKRMSRARKLVLAGID
jgi:predicted GIY-YIG superfamily endonuclease